MYKRQSQASWTVAEAERIGAAYRLEQEAVVDAALEGLRDPEGDFLTPIRWLRNGSTTQNPEADARMVRDLHRATEDGVSPAWLPSRLVDGIRAHDERVGQLMNEETDPVLAP